MALSSKKLRKGLVLFDLTHFCFISGLYFSFLVNEGIGPHDSQFPASALSFVFVYIFMLIICIYRGIENLNIAVHSMDHIKCDNENRTINSFLGPFN